MSDYEDDNEENYDFGFYDDDEKDVQQDDDDIQLKDEVVVNGHDADEEDVNEMKMENELYEHNEEQAEQDEPDTDEVEEVVVEEKVVSKFVPKSERKTVPFMTKFEYSYLISQRALAIGNNSPLMIPDTEYIHAIDIAKEETLKGVNPIIMQRELPNGMIEEWTCSELKLPEYY